MGILNESFLNDVAKLFIFMFNYSFDFYSRRNFVLAPPFKNNLFVVSQTLLVGVRKC